MITHHPLSRSICRRERQGKNLIVILALLLCTNVFADCQRAIRDDAPDPKYQQRQDVCEGLYWQDVAISTGLRLGLLGFHLHSPRYDLGQNSDPLEINVWAPGANDDDDHMLTVVSTLPDKYYQMDTASVKLADGYSWMSLLNAASIESHQLAAVVCTDCNKLTDTKPVYFATSIADSRQNAVILARNQPPSIVVRVPRGTRTLLVSLWNESEGLILDQENAGAAPYDNDTPVRYYFMGQGLKPGRYELLLEVFSHSDVSFGETPEEELGAYLEFPENL